MGALAPTKEMQGGQCPHKLNHHISRNNSYNRCFHLYTLYSGVKTILDPGKANFDEEPLNQHRRTVEFGLTRPVALRRPFNFSHVQPTCCVYDAVLLVRTNGRVCCARPS